MKVLTDKKQIKELVSRSIDRIYPTTEGFEKELASGRRLRVYLGVDPTGPHLHLGHATNLLLLRKFQDLGHETILLIGDFTARIGDPTDKSAARKPLTKEEIKENLKTFKTQVEKIISFDGNNPTRIEFNSKWNDPTTFEELIKLAQNFTVQQMIERDMFQERLKNGKPIGLHEFLYPLIQGYDSVVMDVDVEIGGTDQTFNMLTGRTLLKILKKKEKFVITTKLLLDPITNMKIMNKSEGGLVNLDDEPEDMFGKVMALKDSAIIPIAEFSTNMSEDDINKLSEKENPRDAKLKVAYEVIKTYHSEKDAENVKEKWIKIFSKKEIPDDVPRLKVGKKNILLLDLLIKSGVESKSEARRLVLQSAIQINEETKKDPNEIISIQGGEILKVGKKKFFKLLK